MFIWNISGPWWPNGCQGGSCDSFGVLLGFGGQMAFSRPQMLGHFQIKSVQRFRVLTQGHPQLSDGNKKNGWFYFWHRQSRSGARAASSDDVTIHGNKNDRTDLFLASQSRPIFSVTKKTSML